MKDLNLILTQQNEITNKNLGKNFYLGAWCLADMKKDNYDDFLIHNYHWDDRIKFQDDYNGLIDHISLNFDIFSEYMNEITGTKKDQRYWKINLGPWFGYILQILFDRWETIRTLPNLNFNLPQKKNDILLLRSNTVRDFFTDFFTDEWNENIYRQIILAQNKKINFKKKNISDFFDKKKNFYKTKNKIPYSSKKSLFLKFITKLIHKFHQPKYFIINSYLSRKDEMKLKLNLKELPFIYERSIFDPKINYNFEKKLKKLNPISFKIKQESSWSIKNQDFLSWFERIVPYLIPNNYSLHFNTFFQNMKALPFPKNPKSIFTSVLHVQHDYFNLYAAEKVFSGTKYIIGQHGGTFRSAKFNYVENLQKEIPDYYVTWGKDGHNDDSFPAKVISVGNLKISSKNIKNKYRSKRILLLTVEYPRFSYMLSSVVNSSQWLEYYKDIKLFIDKSSELDFVKKITIRNKYRKQPAWNLKEKLLNEYPDLRFDRTDDYFKSIKNSSLVVSTYNGATYLETMSLNVPTIFFWNPNFWELKENSVIDYHKLIKVGIFHENPASAAKFINKIYNNIESWWFSEEVQTARYIFCRKYSQKNKKLIFELKRIIK